jgi:AcrR family transcriptional regulator
MKNHASKSRTPGGVTLANFTKKAIKASFLKLLTQQPLHKITVRDIVEDCGINRNSFYYHFHDIPALLEEIITEQVNALIQQYPSIASLDECLDAAFQTALENKRAVMHIYHSVSHDIFERSMMKICEHMVTAYFNTALPNPLIPDCDRNNLIRFVKCELFGMCIEWILNEMRNDAVTEFHQLMALCRKLSDEMIQKNQAAAFPSP